MKKLISTLIVVIILSGCNSSTNNSFLDRLSVGCEMACSYQGEYEEGDVIKQPEAKLGDLTKCFVSGVVFMVTEDSPIAEHNGKKYYACCQTCSDLFNENPEEFLS